MSKRCSVIRPVTLCLMLLLPLPALAWFGGNKAAQPSPSYVSDCARQLNQADGAVRVRGYGQADSFQQAKVEALRDISERISVQVSGRSETRSRLENGEASSSFRSVAALETQLRIDEAVQICADNDDPAGLWHVVFEFDSRTPMQRLGERLTRSYGGHPLDFVGNPFLINSQLVSELQAAIGSAVDRQAAPRDLPLALRRQHGGWYLTAGSDQVRLRDDDVFQAIHFPHSGQLLLSLMRANSGSGHAGQLQQGEHFSLRVDSPLSGYLSVFNIYGDGRVSLLAANQPLAGNKAAEFPGGDLTYEAGLLEAGKTTRDVYLAVITAQPIQPSTIHQLRESRGLVAGESSYQLHALFAMLAEREADVASIVVTTLPI